LWTLGQRDATGDLIWLAPVQEVSRYNAGLQINQTSTVSLCDNVMDFALHDLEFAADGAVMSQ
jgi:hypothetical protein